MTVDCNDSWEDGPDDSFVTTWSGQASIVGVVTSGVDGLQEVSQVNAARSVCIWVSDTLYTLCSELENKKFQR